MKVNGKQIILQEPCSVQEFLLRQGYGDQKVAVERNGEILPRQDYEQTLLTSEDILEIVCFVGGG